MGVSTGSLRIPDHFADLLQAQPETGMSFQAVTIALRDGRKFKRVVVVDGIADLATCDAFQAAPFSSDDLVGLTVTHDRSGPSVEEWQ